MPTLRNRTARPARPARPGRPGRRPPMSPRSRFIRRLLMALLAGVTILLLARTGTLDQALQRIGPERLNWNNDYQLVEHLRDVVVRRGLTTDRKDCLLFIIDGNDPPQASRMRVMEKHSGSCPGTPGQLPQLFTLKVDRPARTVQTDAGSPGLFHPLP